MGAAHAASGVVNGGAHAAWSQRPQGRTRSTPDQRQVSVKEQLLNNSVAGYPDTPTHAHWRLHRPTIPSLRPPVGVTNPVLAACLGYSVNEQPIISQESAYVVIYIALSS